MFKKLVVFLSVMFLTTNVYALDLSRVKSWSASEVLTAADLNAEFNNILNHSLTNNDIDASAGILGSKLNLAIPGTIGNTTPSTGAFTTLSASGILSALDKVSFTQTDNLEYIDSLADGFLDLEATTGIRLRINTTEQVNLTDGVLAGTTDNDIDLGSTTKEFKDLWIDGTAEIDTLNSAIAALTKVTSTGVHLTETTAPTTAAGKGALYTKDTNGQPELFYREESDGDEVQMTRAGKTLGITEYIIASDATWDVPAGVSKVYISMCGGGGGGAGGSDGTTGGGGAGGTMLVNFPVTVTPGGEVAIVIGAGGNAGAVQTSGTDGGETSFGSVTVAGGDAGNFNAAGGIGAEDYDASGNTGGKAALRGGHGAGFEGAGGPGGGGTLFGAGGNMDVAAAANTGGGGGGANVTGPSGKAGRAGGSGVCIIMY